MLKPTRKKRYIELLRVTAFMQSQSKEIQQEYADIVNELERNGRLSMPTGEKVDSTFFSIRVMQAGNVRVFYVYGKGSNIYGLHGYVKKTQQIPAKEKKAGGEDCKALAKGGFIMRRVQNIDKELKKEVKHFAQHLEALHAQQSDVREKILTDPANAEFLKECRERRAVAEALYQARTTANLTQAEVAARMNVSQPYIVKLERGKGSISWKVISRYAAACGRKVEITLV